jgi:hypothetical protein
MFGLWILVMIFAPIGLACVILGSIAIKCYRICKNKLEYRDSKGYSWNYSDSNFDRTHCPPEDLPRVQMAYKKIKFWDWMDDNEGAFYVIGALCLIAAIILTLVAICAPLGAIQEYAYWQQFKPMAESILASSDPYQSIGITDKIIEYNAWLAKARASQEAYGNWSMYYKLDLSQLDYIRMGQ